MEGLKKEGRMRQRQSRNQGQDTLDSAAVSDSWQADQGGGRRCNGRNSRGSEEGMHQHPSMDAPIAARLRLPGGGRMRAFLLALVVACIFPCCSTTTGGHGQPVFSPSSQSWGGWKPSVPPGLGFAAEGGSHRRIIGGVDAQGRYPWAVQIGKVGGQALTCSGQLIGGRWVLTAAHCVMTADSTGYRDVGPPGSTQVTVGCGDLNSQSCRTLNVYRIIVHPCHTPSLEQKHDDIALLELYDDPGIATLPYIAGLNGTVDFTNGTNLTLAGFGITDNAAQQVSSKLLEVKVPLATRQACEAANPASAYYGSINFSHVICTGGAAGKDSCGGDSGGPAILEEGGKQWVVGVLSKGSELPSNTPDCGVEGRYGVYTRISKYSDFLREIMFNVPYTCKTCPCTCEGPTCGDISRALPWSGPPQQQLQTTPIPNPDVNTTPAPAVTLQDSPSVTFIGYIFMGVGFTVLIASCVAVAVVIHMRRKADKVMPMAGPVPSSGAGDEAPLSARSRTSWRKGSIASRKDSLVPFERQGSVGSMPKWASRQNSGNSLAVPNIDLSSPDIATRTASAPNSARVNSGGLQQRRTSITSTTEGAKLTPRKIGLLGGSNKSLVAQKPPRPVPAAVVPALEIAGGFKSSGPTPLNSARTNSRTPGTLNSARGAAPNAAASFDFVQSSGFKSSRSTSGDGDVRAGSYLGQSPRQNHTPRYDVLD